MSKIIILQNIEQESPGNIIPIASQQNIQSILIKVFKNEEIIIPCKDDILIVLGGPMSLRDIHQTRYSWLYKELEIIDYCLNQGISVMGICLGAQLLSKAAGGDIEPLRYKHSDLLIAEIGWSKIYPTYLKHNYNTFISSPLEVLHWHRDRIRLPTSAKLLASSNLCQEQMFMIGTSAIGIQFHIEVSYDEVNEWIQRDKAFIEFGLGVYGQEFLSSMTKKIYYNDSCKRYQLLRRIIDHLKDEANR